MLKKIHRIGFKGFTLVELMVVVAILGILSIVAVPAFIKYMRRAKTMEAIDELDKIYKGSAFYYTAPKYDGMIAKIHCQFPTDEGLTPGTSCCDHDGNQDGRCDSNTLAWNSRTWSALSFQITDEVYFVYSWGTNGKEMAAAKATANAHADLDCDGETSTFQRFINGDPAATYAECASIGATGYYIDNETE